MYIHNKSNAAVNLMDTFFDVFGLNRILHGNKKKLDSQ